MGCMGRMFRRSFCFRFCFLGVRICDLKKMRVKNLFLCLLVFLFGFRVNGCLGFFYGDMWEGREVVYRCFERVENL